jgi:hypothetical protein
MARRVIEARVIRWERSQGTWGVAVRYDDHTRETYPVGDRGARRDGGSEAHARRRTRNPPLDRGRAWPFRGSWVAAAPL